MNGRQALRYLLNRKYLAELKTAQLWQVDGELARMARSEIQSRPCEHCERVICLPDGQHPGICCECYDKHLEKRRSRLERKEARNR